MKTWPENRFELVTIGEKRMVRFCRANDLPIPKVVLKAPAQWQFKVCAYYRPKLGINMSVEKCGRLAGEAESRNWTWPGSTTDREPFGVIAHELGHHCDWHRSEKKGSYYGDYSIGLRARVGEAPLTSYCDNDAEWFAEMFRLFVTNHALLRLVRPRTHAALIADNWKPVSSDDWREELGANIPGRVLRALRNKMPKGESCPSSAA